MTSLESVSTDDLRDVLAEVERKKPTQRLMAAINYLEEDDASLAEVAGRYGYTGPWRSQWLDRLERLDGQNGSEDTIHSHASEPVEAGSLRPIPAQTHLAESFVSGTAAAVPLSSSTP